MALSSGTTEKLNDLRSRIALNEEFTKEEITEAIKLLRSERMTGVSEGKQAAGKKAPSSKLPTDLNDLFAS